MSTDAAYFGIDFGTTNSSIAWYDPEKGEAKILRNAEGEEKIPSLVYFGKNFRADEVQRYRLHPRAGAWLRGLQAPEGIFPE